jgi:hypothetical protein
VTGARTKRLLEGMPTPPAPIVPPLVLVAEDDLLFFRSAAHLEAYVEAIDVANGEYGSCWDAEGRLLKLRVEGTQAAILRVVPYRRDVVRVEMVEERPSHQADLHFALLRYVEDVGLKAEMPLTNDMADLLAFAIEHAGWS